LSKLVIEGPTQLQGTIKISGSKNHALPMLAAMLLTTEDVILHNVPDIADVNVMIEILECYGVRIERTRTGLICNAENARPVSIPTDLTRKLRASLLVLGPALARFSEAELGFPGGDLIGARPIDSHLNGLRSMGAKVIESEDTIRLKGKLKEATVILDEISVTATENLIMASVLTPGLTEIRLAATEPHIVALGEFLNSLELKLVG